MQIDEAVEARECYDLLTAVCSEGVLPLAAAYRRMRELLEHLCQAKAQDSSFLQMTDLAARINYVSAQLSLSVVEQNRLHTFRLASNDILNRRAEPTKEHLLRDAKTLAFFVRRLTGQTIPESLYRLLPQADATYIVSPPAKGHRKRLRVTYQYAQGGFLYVLPSDVPVDGPLRVRCHVPQVNDEFDETCRCLWQGAQLNLLDVNVDESGVLTPSFLILEPDYLIDISTLAECFKDYGHHPANYLLMRFQPVGNTRPLLLGNIVNLFLDEWIHAQDEPDYLACMKKAFRRYPIELAACTDLRDRDVERTFFDDDGRNRSPSLIYAGFEDLSDCAAMWICPEFKHFSLKKNRVKKLIDSFLLQS